jgi:hypothetical protein
MILSYLNSEILIDNINNIGKKTQHKYICLPKENELQS